MKLGDPREIYSGEYIQQYHELYIDDSVEKISENIVELSHLLGEDSSWLDVCCGAGVYFSFFSEVPTRVGVDISPGQIESAIKLNPECKFFCEDFLEFDPSNDFDLVTCFWQGYFYSDDVTNFCNKMISHVKPGGHLYIEILLPGTVRDISRFDSRFGAENIDGDKWLIFDPFVEHVGVAPPPKFFEEIFSNHFKNVRGFVGANPVNFQMICTNKLTDDE